MINVKQPISLYLVDTLFHLFSFLILQTLNKSKDIFVFNSMCHIHMNNLLENSLVLVKEP
jgi:hypothetical protein